MQPLVPPVGEIDARPAAESGQLFIGGRVVVVEGLNQTVSVSTWFLCRWLKEAFGPCVALEVERVPDRTQLRIKCPTEDVAIQLQERLRAAFPILKVGGGCSVKIKMKIKKCIFEN